MFNLPDCLEEYSAAKKKGFIRMLELKESGKEAVHCFVKESYLCVCRNF